MSMRRIVAVQAAFLSMAIFASATTKETLRIKVLDSETQSVSLGGSNGVPNDCDQVTFDAYCRSGRTAILTNTLLVQASDGPPFRIACTIDSKFSKCTPLPVGESFDAKREKHGIIVYYEDDKGKERKQLYTLVASNAAAGPPLAAAPAAVQPTPAPHQASPATTAPSAVPVTPSAPAPAQPQAEISSVKVRCKFASMPAGADISIDDKYVGNTPSEIDLVVGTHVVVFSMQGFSQWKRDLTVMSGSELTVSAILQKQ